MHDVFIKMTIAKKWDLFRKEYGVEFKDPWEPLIEAARELIPEQYFKVSPWTEEHFHDWVMAPAYPGRGVITWGPASCSKSHDTGLLMLLDWMNDPYDTVIRLGSTDKQSLKSRSWNAVITFFAALRRNKLGLTIPGKFSKSGYAILNDDSDESPESVGEKAGIVGVAINDSEDSGKLQGAHAKFVRIVVDELATITHHDNIKKAIQNLRVGAVDFRFYALANPASWDDPSCQYCIPVQGMDKVDVDTGSWVSTRGYFIRHHDGHKCIAVTDPEKAKEFPFLLTQEVIDANLADCDGNPDASMYWQMVRGFPVPTATNVPVVLESRTAAQNHVTDRIDGSLAGVVATVAGIDPAWSEGGDGAIRARAYIRQDMFGRYYLDFTDGLDRLPIKAHDPRPPVQQMMDRTIELMKRPLEASFHFTAVDASANQGLADDLLLYAGADCLGVNNSVRASDVPMRAMDTRPARDIVYDRGTESWCVLAEFCKAGMVRGLPPEALRALTTRRFAVRHGTGTVMNPLRLEDKKSFRTRFRKSPDEADACALAALAAKERLGLVPFGALPVPEPTMLTSTAASGPRIAVPQSESWSAGPVDGEDGYTSPC
jgi:hypothetical protein